jgi:hypothetical protein
LIPLNVDEHANEPGFFVLEARRNRLRRAGSVQKCFLEEVECGNVAGRTLATGSPFITC